MADRPSTSTRKTANTRLPIRLVARRPWVRTALKWGTIPAIIIFALLGFYWMKYARLIDVRLKSEHRPIPRIFGRPVEIETGAGLSPAELSQRLNDLGYTQVPKVVHGGEFAVAGNAITMMTRGAGGAKPETVRVDFSRGRSPVVSRLTLGARTETDHVTMEAPLLAAMATGEKRRYVPISAIPERMIDAVVAIEDHRFFEHPGVDPIGIMGALVSDLTGRRGYTSGGSTITQQVVRNEFLTEMFPGMTLEEARQKSPRRKLLEIFIALDLEARASKDQILEMYLNDVPLGQRGPFEIQGVAEAARLFFDKDVSNISIAEAATIAGLIQSPSWLSPFRNPERAVERRNVVLTEMASYHFITKDQLDSAEKEPLKVAQRALEGEAPYFVDYVSQLVDDQYAGLLKKDTSGVDVYTTLDLSLQRIAQEAVAEGLADVDKQVSKKKRGEAQAALVAVDPHTGEILAFVGGRAYNLSQYDRAAAARRQPGSTFKPFVYLAAMQKAADDGRTDITPASIVVDEPTTFIDDMGKPYTPQNYQNEYDGPITLRQALAHSRNIVAIKVAQMVGFDTVADFWKRIGEGETPKPYASIALGVFGATPLEMATAYTLFTNDGAVRPLTAVTRIVENGKSRSIPAPEPRPVARPDATYVVTHMMEGVLEDGTAADARAQGFTLEAAGKTGTTNDLRDAWFIGFTPDLLTVVWVGMDNNQPIGLTGTQAALPIWTLFMKRALAGHASQPFPIPGNVVFETFDRVTGKLATPSCPETYTEAFIAGTEPHDFCSGHSPVKSALAKLGSFFARIIRK